MAYDWTIRSVKVSWGILVGCICLYTVEILDQLLITPIVVAHLCPPIVIIGDAPKEYLAVDGARTSRDFTPRNEYLSCVGTSSCVLPVVVAC